MPDQLEEKVEEDAAGIGRLALERVQFALDRLKVALSLIPDANEAIGQVETEMQNVVAKYALSLQMGGKLDSDALKAFFKQPYPKLMQEVGPDGKVAPNAWILMVPRFIPLQVGFLVSQDEAWNYFRVNRFMDWFGEIPEFIKKQIGWTEPPDLRLEGEELVGSPEAIDAAWKEFKPYLKGREGDRLLVNKEHAYELMVGLLKKGVKPFTDSPIDPADLVERKCDYELYDYQKDIWETMLKKGSVGIFIPPSTGKTVLGVWAATHIKPPTLVVVPNLTLKEQWEERFSNHTDLKLGEEVVVATYYDAIKNYSKKDFTLKIYDEVHHLPANHFIKLSWLKAKYTMGLSATPYREDNAGRDIGGEEMIFALTGEPVGLSWQHFKELRLIKNPTCFVWVEKNEDARMRRLGELLKVPKKTVIFSDSLEKGEFVAARYGIPFVQGSSKDRLKTLTEAQTAVVSRVGDEGVSLPDIERVIEISWLFGSRRQELQRFARLLHGKESKTEGEAHVLMTLEEWVRDKKRFFSIMDRGFKIVIKREGIEEKVVQRAEAAAAATPRQRKSTDVRPGGTPLPSIPAVLTQRLPGITKTLERLPSVEKAVAQTILGNPQQAYTTKELALATGLALSTVMNRGNFGHLIELGLIRKDGAGKYRSAL